MKKLLQDLFMVPMHAVEGIAVRWRFPGPLYRALSTVYQIPRRYFYFGEKKFLKNVSPGECLLDLGCGPGYLTGLLENRFRVTVGLDLEEGMLKKARAFSQKAVFVRGDMTRLPFRGNVFDCVVSLGAVHCVDYDRLAAVIYDILAPGGEALILVDDRVIPFFAPQTSAASLKTALERSTFQRIRVEPVGRLYALVCAEK